MCSTPKRTGRTERNNYFHAGRLHLHPISETHQFRPTMTYMDMHTRKTRRGRGGDDSDEDDGPPPDPDEPAPAPAPKKEKKPTGEAREVQVAVRKTGESSGPQFQGGMTQVRREMLTLIHAEEDERWEDFEYCGGEVRGIFCISYCVLMLMFFRPQRRTKRSSRCFRPRSKS